MKRISRLFLFGALAIILLTAACAPEEGTSTVVGTLPPDDLTPSPFATEGTTTGTAETETTSTVSTSETTTSTADLTGTAPAATDTTQTASIPVTGDLILLECQF